MRANVALVIGAVALGGCATLGCGRSPTIAQAPALRVPARPEQGEGGGAMGHSQGDMCPMAVVGTTAWAADVVGGVAIAFTTTGDVTEVRRRVARMVEMHEQHHGEGRGPVPTSGANEMMTPPSSARGDELRRGARIVFTPRDPADLATLREHARRRARTLAAGLCVMPTPRGAGGQVL